MTVTRLVGGLTPGDGSDPRTFPAIWNATADVIDAVEADSLPTDVSSPVAGQKLVFDGTNWVNLTGYVFVQTVYFTSSGTFSKADYPWLRAIRVKCQGAGGGGSGSGSDNQAGGGGGAGGYAESFITDISGLASSVTVTRGAGGAGGASGNNSGSGGGSSSFGSIVIGNGGGGGLNPTSTGQGGDGTGGTGDVLFSGGSGNNGTVTAGGTPNGVNGPNGGDSYLGGGGRGGPNGQGQGQNGFLYGGGGGGSFRINASFAGAAGANGIVIVELFA